MKLLLLLALIGLGAAFEVGKEYSYDYFSHIGLGIPQIKEQVAAGGLKAKMKVQIVKPNQAIVMLENVEVGEFHGISDCGLRSELPINYAPVSGIAKNLEEPFEINLQLDTVGNIMVVNKNEPEYVVNIKKSIAHFLIMRPISKDNANIVKLFTTLLKNNGGTPFLSVKEETFYGRCEVEYTLYPERVMPPLNTPRPDGSEGLPWIMRKTINFDKCDTNVVLQHNGVSNSTNAGTGGIGTVETRSSVSNYFLQTTQKGIAVLRGHSEGVIVLNPFGYRTEKLMSLANQTMVLTSEKEISNVVTVRTPTKIIRSWQMEFASPFKQGYMSPPWVNFKHMNIPYPPMLSEISATGFELTKDVLEEFKKNVENAIEESANIIYSYPSKAEPGMGLTPFDTPESMVPFYLDSVSRLVRGLKLEYLEKLFNQYKQDTTELGVLKFELFVDACAASGAGAPLSLLMDKMETKEIPMKRALTIFMTLANNIASPEVLPKIMKLIRTMHHKNSNLTPQQFYLTSTALINLATAIHRVCLDKNSWSFSVPYQLYGDENCSPTKGVELMLPFLKELLTKAETTPQKIVVTKAISDLGTARSLSVLKQIIFGLYGRNTLMRSVALYGLLHYKMSDVYKHQVQMVLQPIIDNTEIDIQLRQVALVVALSWQPSETWWNQLASFSWQEPSEIMGSFIYSTMWTMSKTKDPKFIAQSRYAEYALRFAKPHPMFGKPSINYILGEYLHKDHMRTFLDVAAIGSHTSVLPREVFLYLSNSFGGFNFPLFEIAFTNKGFDSHISRFLNMIVKEDPSMQSYTHEEHPQNRHPRDLSSGIVSVLKDELQMENLPEEELEASFYFKILGNIQMFLPVNKNLMHQVMHQVQEFVQELRTSKKIWMTKFINPVTAEMLIPTQIGLPIMTRLTTPTLISKNGTLSGHMALEKSTMVKGEVMTNFKLINKVVTTLRVLLPWSNKLIATGVETLKNINLPFKMGFKLDRMSKSKMNTSLWIESLLEDEFPVVHKHNIPFTVVKRLWPGGNPKDITVKPVTVLSEGTKLVEEKTFKFPKSVTGLDAKMLYHGDRPFPLTPGHLVDLVKYPTTILKLIAAPSAKAYQFAINLNLGKSETKGLNMSFAHEMELPSHSWIIYNGKCKGTLLLTGKQNRYFEMSSLHTTVPMDKQVEHELKVNLLRSPLPGLYEKSGAYCFSTKVVRTKINDLDSLKEAINSGSIKRTLTGTLMGGAKCDQEILKVDGESQVSNVRLQQLKKEVNVPCLIHNKEAVVNLKTEPIFDEAKIQFKYSQNLPNIVYNTSYHLYDFSRGMNFPHVYFNYLNIKNPNNQITFNGIRHLGEHFWKFDVALPTQNIIFDKVSIWHRLQQILNINIWPSKDLLNRPVPVSDVIKACRITPQMIKSFDGVVYNFPMKPCYVVSSVNMRRPKQEPIVLTRKDQSGMMEAMVTLEELRTTFIVNQHQVFVSESPNAKGQPFTPTKTPKEIVRSGHLTAIVFKVGNEIVLEIPYKMVVVVKPSVILIYPLHALQRGSLGGVCGTYSNNLKYQFIGPKHAFYNKTELFPYSWMLTEGQGCPKQEVVSQRHVVKEYQERYQRFNATFQLYQEKVPNDGLEYVFLIKTRANLICLSEKPIGMCIPGHQPRMEKVFSEVYKCWKDTEAPEIVKKSVNRGYTKEHVNSIGLVTTSFDTKHDLICTH